MPSYPLNIYSLKRQRGLAVSSIVFSVHSPFRALPPSASYAKTYHFSSCSSRSLSYSIELITFPSNSSPFETGPGLAVPTSPQPNIFAKKLAVAFPALSRGPCFHVSFQSLWHETNDFSCLMASNYATAVIRYHRQNDKEQRPACRQSAWRQSAWHQSVPSKVLSLPALPPPASHARFTAFPVALPAR